MHLSSYAFNSPNLECSHCEYRVPIKEANGSIYLGQWNKNGKKEGRGTWLYAKGATWMMIEGYYKNGKVYKNYRTI